MARITMTIEAENTDDLLADLFKMLGGYDPSTGRSQVRSALSVAALTQFDRDVVGEPMKPAELNDYLSNLANQQVASTEEPAKTRGRPRKAAPAASAEPQPEQTSAAPASEEAAEEPIPPTSSASPASGSELVDLNGLKAALAEFLKKKSVSDAKAVFAKYDGAASVGSLDPKHYSAVKAEFQAA